MMSAMAKGTASCVYEGRTYAHGATWLDYKPEGTRQYRFTYRCEDGKVVETSRLFLYDAKDGPAATPEAKAAAAVLVEKLAVKVTGLLP